MPTLNLSDSKQTLLEQVKLFGRFNCDLRDTVVLFIFANHKFDSVRLHAREGVSANQCESPSLIVLQYPVVLIFFKNFEYISLSVDNLNKNFKLRFYLPIFTEAEFFDLKTPTSQVKEKLRIILTESS